MMQKDVREIIETALDFYVEYWEYHDESFNGSDFHNAEADARIVHDWLDAQDAATERWEPVERMDWTLTGTNLSSAPYMAYIEGKIGIEYPDTRRMWAAIPGDYALCRKVEVRP